MIPRILVVDDEPDVQDLIKRRFRKQIRAGEFEFDFAHDGQEALDRINNEGQFDIILSDINMPRMDGLTLLTHLRERTDDMKTIMVSAYGDMDNIRIAMNRGAFDFVTKPINFDDLLTTIHKSLKELEYLKDIVERLTHAETAKKYMEHELQIGHDIQKGFLPTKIPEVEGWQLNAYFRSAREVAGDFYDIFEIEGHSRIGVVVADVCDKGVGAALFMTLFRSLLRSTAKMHEYADMPDASKEHYFERPDLLLKRCVHFTNNYIAHTHGNTSMFATVFFGLLEPDNGHMYYINAGHEEPVIIEDGNIKCSLENTGPVVGLFRNSDYEVKEVTLGEGNTLVAFTDGVTDAINVNGEPFTQERLTGLLTSKVKGDLTKVIADEVLTHIGDATQFDDVTIISVSRENTG